MAPFPQSPAKATRPPQGARRWVLAGSGALALLLILGVVITRATSSTPNAAGTVSAPTLTANSPSTTIYTLDQNASTATFTIDEVLLGNPNTVVGTTNQIAGQVALNSADPSKSQVGQIKVDLTSLTTDSARRNGAIQNFILRTSNPANQYATFTPSSIKGLPTTLQTGQTVHLSIGGNLTIHQSTHPTTFTGSAVLNSDHTLSGDFKTTITYADYGISIPNVPSVTGVGKTVILEIKFSAKAGK